MRKYLQYADLRGSKIETHFIKHRQLYLKGLCAIEKLKSKNISGKNNFPVYTYYFYASIINKVWQSEKLFISSSCYYCRSGSTLCFSWFGLNFSIKCFFQI